MKISLAVDYEEIDAIERNFLRVNKILKFRELYTIARIYAESKKETLRLIKELKTEQIENRKFNCFFQLLSINQKNLAKCIKKKKFQPFVSIKIFTVDEDNFKTSSL